jgi:hypothetical protein
VDLFKYIHGFLDDAEKNQLVLLHGTAGVGKSAVALTVAEKMRDLNVTKDTNVEKRLGGTFFFRASIRNVARLDIYLRRLPTNLLPIFQASGRMCRIIRDNPALLDPDAPLCDQMEAFFLRPLRKLQSRLCGCPPLSFVIDALDDECTSEPEVKDLILSLARAPREPDLPVTHILLTSRSETYISKVFQNDEVRPLVREIPVRTSGEGGIISLDGTDVDNDICTFLRHSFEVVIFISRSHERLTLRS